MYIEGGVTIDFSIFSNSDRRIILLHLIFEYVPHLIKQKKNVLFKV